MASGGRYSFIYINNSQSLLIIQAEIPPLIRYCGNNFDCFVFLFLEGWIWVI